MGHTGKIRLVRNEMLNLYGQNCWMLYSFDKKNAFTYHHMLEQRKGGKTTIENGAILTFWAHQDLNQLDEHNKSMYRDLNLLFKELNDTGMPPTIEYYKQVNGILLKAREIIILSKFNNLDIDYGLLKEMIDKANEEGNTRGHLELVSEYYDKINGIYVEPNKIEEIIYIEPVREEMPKPKLSKRDLIRKAKEEEQIYIPEEHKSKVKHKNRNHNRYVYRKNRMK